MGMHRAEALSMDTKRLLSRKGILMSAKCAGNAVADEAGMKGGDPCWVRERTINDTAKGLGVCVMEDIAYDCCSDGMCIAHAEYRGINLFGEHSSPSDAMLLVIIQIRDLIIEGVEGCR